MSKSSLPVISVITVALNAANTIGATLESVASQQGFHEFVEHIVVDGGSMDNTLEIIRQYPHVRWISEPDRGISDAFNKGMHLAQGQYLLYLNADDTLCDSRVLADVAKFAQTQQWPEWIVGDVNVKDVHGVIKPGRLGYAPSCWSLIFRDRIPHPATFVKRALLVEMNGFDLDFRLAMDYDLWARLCAAGCEVTYFKRPIAVFAEGGMTTTQRQRGRTEAAQIRQRLRNTPFKRLAGTLYDRLKRR